MLGENPGEEVAGAEQRRSFSQKPVWQRFLVVACGPLFNLFFALFVFFIIYSISGLPHSVEGTKIGLVTQESPAERMGIQSGDIILTVNGQETKVWQDISDLVKNSGGGELLVTIERNGTVLAFTGQPEKKEVKNIFGEVTEKRYLLGITKSDEITYEKVSIFKAFTAGLEQTWAFIYLTFMGIIKIFQNVIPASEIGGPILIANMAGQQFEAGWLNLFSFMAVLSINLGIINLFPIPILDGGHLVFFTIEALRRKPLSMQTQEMLQQIGIVLLGSLMVFVFYNDFVRIFTQG
jgi:regulator of sigma E protease